MAAALGAAVVGAGVAATVMFGEKAITGTPVANPMAVMQAAGERRAADEKAAAEEKAREEARFLTDLERNVRESMQDYFTDPVNDLDYADIVVSEVSLVKVSEGQFEGMASMSALGNTPRDVKVHVTADERNLMWSTDEGALRPLFN